MRLGVVVTGLVGLGLAAWLLASFGLDRVLDLLRQAGILGILAVIAFHFVQIVASAAAWRTIGPPVDHAVGRRPGLLSYAALRWIREGVNNLLPVAQIGGEFVAARMLQRRGVPLAPAIAGTVADLTMEMVSQVLFTLLGLALLIGHHGSGDLSRPVIGVVVAAALVAAAFLGSQWFGLALLIEKGLLRLGRALGWAGTADVEGLHRALQSCYRRPGYVVGALTWHSASWLLGGLEVQLALHFLGTDIGFAEGVVIESLGQALKAAGFVVPGALGVQEGGLVVICGFYGLSPEIAIALSLIKRLREVVLGVPALLAWRLSSARRRDPALEATP